MISIEHIRRVASEFPDRVPLIGSLGEFAMQVVVSSSSEVANLCQKLHLVWSSPLVTGQIAS